MCSFKIEMQFLQLDPGQQLKLLRIHVDQDPQPWLTIYI
jgi:hypothetical protein